MENIILGGIGGLIGGIILIFILNYVFKVEPPDDEDTWLDKFEKERRKRIESNRWK